MEVEAPEEPIITWKQFLIHIGTVTLGILIALSLEGLVEWNHHRHMINEARENIRSEIKDNLQEMAEHMAALDQNQKAAQNILKWIADQQKAHKSPIRELQVGVSRADLSDTSWSTAHAIGTLGLMNYQEVKRTALVYELQEEFQRLQTRAEDAAITAMSLFTGNFDPNQVTDDQLKTAKQQIVGFSNMITVENQFGKELQKRYTKWLKTK